MEPLHTKMARQQQKLPPLIERIERAMVLLAYLIELDGDEHVPMFERFEAELKGLRQTEDVKARARRLLELHELPRAVKAIGPNCWIASTREDRSMPGNKSPIVKSFPLAAVTTDPAT